MRVCIALVVLALLSVHALAQSEAELNAGKTKLTISVKHGEDGGDAQCEDCDKDENKSLLINLPPEPKAARGYVPKNDLPSNDQSSDVLGVVSAPVVTQPVIVAPVIGAQQPAGEACTDNCDAELAPPPVQIAGPTVASKVLGKEIFDDDAYIPVPDTQTEAKPAMVSVPEHLRDLPPPDGGPTKRCQGDECGDDSSSSSSVADHVHGAAARQVDHDSHEIALAREKARRARQDEEDRREEEFQAERRKWRKEALEEEEEEERRRKQASIADADRFKQKLPSEHRIPATPVEPADDQPDLQISETDTCGTPPCQKVVVAVCEQPPCAPSPPCGCIGTPSCACAPPLVATPPPCGCIGTPSCACATKCDDDDEECQMMTRAEMEAKAKEAAEARAHEEKIKARTKMEEELRKHQDNIDQVSRMTRGLRYQYGILRKQHERIKQQMLAAKIALKNLGPDPFKGTEYDIEGPEPKAWDDLGLDDTDDDTDGTIPERPLTNLDTVVKVVKRGVYGMPPQQAAKLLAARDIQAAMNASELIANATTSDTMKKQQQIAEMITSTAVRNADSTLGFKTDPQASAVLEKLKATLAADANQATGGNPSDEQVKKIASILATMDPSKSSRQILKDLDDRSRNLQKQEEDDQMSFDWQQSLFKLNKMVQSFGKQHTYQKNTLDTSQINNRIKVCHFLNEWGVLDDYCKWLLYDAFKVHLAPPKPKPAAPQPEPKKPEEKKPEPAPAAAAPPPPPPPPPKQEEDDTNYLPSTYGATFGWAHALPKKPFPI